MLFYLAAWNTIILLNWANYVFTSNISCKKIKYKQNRNWVSQNKQFICILDKVNPDSVFSNRASQEAQQPQTYQIKGEGLEG